MSCELINRSPDLTSLRDEGFEVAVVDGFVVLTGIPYVTTAGEIRRGSLMAPLSSAGDTAAKPSTHVVHFQGEFPCHRDGKPIEALRHGSKRTELSQRLVADHTFSNKPPQGYPDYSALMETYANIISAPATSLDPSATPRTRRVVELPADESVFRYADTASSRAGIVKASLVLAQSNVAIIGLGGTGAYILDLVAKTPVKRIHLFDGDLFLTHNAFRAPGAASIEQLRAAPKKVDYFASLYDPLRRHIEPHAVRIDSSNVALLTEMDFVFIAVDDGPTRRLIVDTLLEVQVPFIDVGMGVEQVEHQLLGTLRVTTSTAACPTTFDVRKAIPCASSTDNDPYDTNIQIADLNALNAALAVIRWKKAVGFYVDAEGEHHSTFSTNMHLLTSDGCP